jgi:hypothetical protein
MRHTLVGLTSLAILVAWGCSSQSLRRIGYEALQNVREQQCQKDLASDCPERESYDSYERKRKDAAGAP